MSILKRLFHRGKKQTSGKIISWVDSPEGSYPIVQFVTFEGQEISGVLTRNDVLCLEAMPLSDSRKAELKSKLPIEGILIEYEIARPYVFTGSYV